METFIIISVILITFLIILKIRFEKVKSHELHKVLTDFDIINVYDGNGLIASIFRNHEICWVRKNVSLYKMSKIKDISDHFGEEWLKLKHGGNKNAIKK